MEKKAALKKNNGIALKTARSLFFTATVMI